MSTIPTGPTGLVRVGDAIDRFIDAEIRDLRNNPVQYAFDLLPNPFDLRPRGPSNTHILTNAISHFADEVKSSVDRAAEAGQRSINPRNLISGDCLPPLQQRCQITRDGLVATSVSFSAGGLLSLLLLGLSGMTVLSGVVVGASALGAWAAHTAYEESVRAGETEAFWRRAEENATELRENVSRFTSQLRANDVQIAALRTTREQLDTQVQTLGTENVSLRQTRERLNADVVALTQAVQRITAEGAQYAQMNARLHTFEQEFRADVTNFRAGQQVSQAFINRLEEYTRQTEAARQLYAQFTQDIGRYNQNFGEHLRQLQGLVNQLADPRNTLIRLEEHRQISDRIVAATQQLAGLQAQVALRDGQIRERDLLLGQLRNEHQAILDSYRMLREEIRNASSANHSRLETQVNRLGVLLGLDRALPATQRCEASVNYDVGYGNALAVRAEPNWNDNIPFSYTVSGWKGQLPIGREFKFVIVSRSGVRWETGSNRRLLDPASAQRHFITRPITF